MLISASLLLPWRLFILRLSISANWKKKSVESINLAYKANFTVVLTPAITINQWFNYTFWICLVFAKIPESYRGILQYLIWPPQTISSWMKIVGWHQSFNAHYPLQKAAMECSTQAMQFWALAATENTGNLRTLNVEGKYYY